jgi:hypothetical protein
MSATENQTSSEEPEWSKTNRLKTDLPFYIPNIDKFLVPEVILMLSASTSKMPRADLSLRPDTCWRTTAKFLQRNTLSMSTR